MSKLHLVLAFHNHQPVGNFDHVLEDSYSKAYLPFLEALLDHPRLKVVLHYSGHLLSWIQKRHPEAIEIIKGLVKEDRAEILSGGFYEPILSVLPEKDRISQITELSKFIKKNLDYEPKGMWLAERLWEPHMPKFISQAGIEYVPLDDYHFKLTGLNDSDLLGYYVTEDGGARTNIFPGSEKLRYYIPFRSVDETISYFREIHMRGGNPLLTMADDGEKFGSWPKTYKHCYEDRWLDNFFTALEANSDWITTTTFSEYFSRFQPAGRVYLPAASYREMGEWALPSEGTLEYEYVLEEMEKVIGERAKQLLRGGIWRSFMVKYPESNHIHKRMFMISSKVHEACKINSRKGREAQTELWKSQCNDAYWHGIFGGLYLPHLRSSLFRYLLRAEELANNILKSYPNVEQSDFDCDGYDDIVVNTEHLALAATEMSGSLTELSLYKQNVNMFDILTRRPEAYHSKIAKTANSGPDSTKTIHDQLLVKETGLSSYLVYDEYRRASLLDHFLEYNTGIEALAASEYEELGDFIGGVYSLGHSKKGKNILLSFSREGTARQERLRIDKTLELSGSGKIKVEYLLEGTFSGLFAIEMNISLLGSPHALINAGNKISQIKSTDTYKGIKEFSIEDKFLNLSAYFCFDNKIDLLHYPIETVSLSEQGIERLYQGTSFLFATEIELRNVKKLKFELDFRENK